MSKKKTNTAKIAAACTTNINFDLIGIPQPLHGTITIGKDSKNINSPKVTINDDRTFTFTGSDEPHNLSAEDMMIISTWMRSNRARKFIARTMIDNSTS